MTESVRVSEQPLWQLALVEGIFLVVAGLILWSRHSVGALVCRAPLVTEAAIGLCVGTVLGTLVGFGLLGSPLRRHVVQGVLPLRPVIASVGSIVAMGLLAGVAEELFFRAALQEWIGLSWASILFGLAHSGTARLHEGFGIGKLAYLLATVAAGVLLGLLYQKVGLLASMSAHGSFDIAILLVLAPAISAATRRKEWA
jgi:membrane protease YdiL (CAAX protease family)